MDRSEGDLRLIDKKTFKAFWRDHPEAEAPLTRWYQIASRASWSNIHEAREEFPHADLVTVGSGRIATVFNVAGNNYRLITAVHYNTGVIYLMMVLTHAEYSKMKWKERL
jgi:mRNA interferase HigB